MKRLKTILTCIVIIGVTSGCGSMQPGKSELMQIGVNKNIQTDRMLIWKATLNIEVDNINEAVITATELTERQGGFVEQKSDHGVKSANLTLRIPTKSFKKALEDLNGLGNIIYRNIDGEDVTEQYIDIEARLKNKMVLRNRLKQLLEKAWEVKDILAIEKELNRVQSDIDSMEGRIKSLKGQIELSTIRLRLDRKTILGPLGYLTKGLWWGIKKLFIIRD